MVQNLHQDPFFEQNKAFASLDPKTNLFYPHLKFDEKISGIIMSTTSAEVINGKLKRLAGNGKISFPTGCRKFCALGDKINNFFV